MGFDKQRIYTVLKRACASTTHPVPCLPGPLEPLIDFSLSLVLPFQEGHVVEITQHLALSGFLSLSNMHLRFLHVFSRLDRSFLIWDDTPMSRCTTAACPFTCERTVWWLQCWQ